MPDICPSESASDEEHRVQIICPGLMRTGLKSLAEAFRELGYTHIHDRASTIESQELWSKAIQNKATKEDFQRTLGKAEVVMGLPTFVFWEQILDAFPHAKVVLTTRDEAAWFKSVQEAKYHLDTEAPAAPLRSGYLLRTVEAWMMPSYNRLCDVLRFSWAAALGVSFLKDNALNRHVTCGMFRKHNMYVQHTVPKEQLLVLDVREGWAPLCKFLGRERPEAAFPAVHDVAYFAINEPEKAKRSRKARARDGAGRPEEGETAVLAEAMMLEFRRGLALVALASLLLASLIVIPLLQDTPTVLLIVFALLAAYLSVSIWIAVKYIVRRVPIMVALPAALKIVFVSIGINVIYLVYGILKEELVTVTHMPSIYIVMASRLMAVLVGAVGVAYAHGLRPPGGMLGAPLLDFARFSVANELSTWAGYEMLKYVSFAVQVMAKSTTLLPSMLMGRFLNGTRYDIKEWLKALGLVIAVVAMQLEDKGGGHKKAGHSGHHAQADDSNWSALFFSTQLQMGALLLFVFFVCDSFCNQFQTKVNKANPHMSHYQMMLGGSLFAVFFELILALGEVWYRGDVQSFPLHDGAGLKLFVLALTAAVGQVFIYYTIKEFGAVVLQWIMTTRKVISVAFSLLWFGHAVTWRKLLCISFVFGLLILDQALKAWAKKPAGTQKAQSPKGATKCTLPKCGQDMSRINVRRFSMMDTWSPAVSSEVSTSASEDGSESPPEAPEDSDITIRKLSKRATPAGLGLIPEAANECSPGSAKKDD